MRAAGVDEDRERAMSIGNPCSPGLSDKKGAPRGSIGSGCCGTSGPSKTGMVATEAYLDGRTDTPAGPVPRVKTNLTPRDIWGRWRMRWGIGRHRYRIEPGLYATGTPGSASPVLVTANYKMTFDALRKELEGLDAWILVLETDGVSERQLRHLYPPGENDPACRGRKPRQADPPPARSDRSGGASGA